MSFFPINGFSLLEHCQLYITAMYKVSNCCKIEAEHPEVFCKKVVLKNVAKFTGKPVSDSRFQ